MISEAMSQQLLSAAQYNMPCSLTTLGDVSSQSYFLGTLGVWELYGMFMTSFGNLIVNTYMFKL